MTQKFLSLLSTQSLQSVQSETNVLPEKPGDTKFLLVKVIVTSNTHVPSTSAPSLIQAQMQRTEMTNIITSISFIVSISTLDPCFILIIEIK